ncbi:MAG TPA: DUF6065 family protein [Casimicrobiaceae bacterium]|nr:DUF6065 family protein [Casimicrobiaceae bacterium]
MKLICYALDPDAPQIRPSPATRPWMDAIRDNHAYRCLPLNIANGHGWEILAPFGFSATWSGNSEPRALVLRSDDDGATPPVHRVSSHFGYGIITFHLQYLFRTEAGWDLVASGPWNRPKDGVSPLTGVIETDWLPYPFTMNWQMTRPGRVRFERGEPICFIFPSERGKLEATEPEIVAVQDHPDVDAKLREWQARRADLMRELAQSPRELKDAWLRYYFVGQMPDGTAIPEHRTRLKLAVPVDRRSK